jgi:Protein of unknown function (DUF1440)
MKPAWRSAAGGLFAGVIGTAAMTAAQSLGARLEASGDEASPKHTDPWAEAPAPAQVAKRIGEGVFGLEVPSRLIPALTELMHWGYGIAWGGVYGLANRQASLRGLNARRGAAFGLLVWMMSYVQLVPLGIYKPPWEYPASELRSDAAYHVAYGIGTAAAFRN